MSPLVGLVRYFLLNVITAVVESRNKFFKKPGQKRKFICLWAIGVEARLRDDSSLHLCLFVDYNSGVFRTNDDDIKN